LLQHEKICSRLSTNWGRLDAQFPAIIVISAEQTAIINIKGHKIMIRDQFVHPALIKAILIKLSFSKKAANRLQMGCKITCFFSDEYK